MNVSPRDVFRGKITTLIDAEVNAEVELTLAGGDKLVAIVPAGSVESLGLALRLKSWSAFLLGDIERRLYHAQVVCRLACAVLAQPRWLSWGDAKSISPR